MPAYCERMACHFSGFVSSSVMGGLDEAFPKTPLGLQSWPQCSSSEGEHGEQAPSVPSHSSRGVLCYAGKGAPVRSRKIEYPLPSILLLG